jgi:hypothetical protein
LRQSDQERGLAEAEPARLLAEIGERGSAHTFQVPAVRRETEIKRENLVLG